VGYQGSASSARPVGFGPRGRNFVIPNFLGSFSVKGSPLPEDLELFNVFFDDMIAAS
jgi:hypothetical protein